MSLLFDRCLPRLLAPRRIGLLLALVAIVAVLTTILTLPGSIPHGPSLSQIADHKITVPRPHIPDSVSSKAKDWSANAKKLGSQVLNPFKQPSHPPPRQKNDTLGESSWYSNWKWMAIPFSSSVTLDENRSLLPPLKNRPNIYCYYDNTIKKDKETREAESAILLTWRRAWWAQGFNPIILSPAEAINNPLYEQVQSLTMEPDMKKDLMRFLAWEKMDGGLLADYLLLPMGGAEDPLMSYLRRGEYPALTRWKDLRDGLFAGSKQDISTTLKLVMNSDLIKDAPNIIEAAKKVNPDPFKEDQPTKVLAFYTAKAVEKHYLDLGNKIRTNRNEGLKDLNQLINAHLHNNWQNRFSEGISILKPRPQHTTNMVQPALDLALQLGQCPPNPVPKSCPPNNQGCTPCESAKPFKIKTMGAYRNSSSLYTIGVVPHPFTFLSLSEMRETIDVPWLRRHSQRDPWLNDITKGLLGDKLSSSSRILRFKEAVAGEHASARSLWMSAEKELPDDLEWHFGFAFGGHSVDTASQNDKSKDEGDNDGDDTEKKEESEDTKEKNNAPQPSVEHEPPKNTVLTKEPTPEELKRETTLLDKSKKIGHTKDENERKLRSSVESWNLGDTEAWRFARAYRARERMERLKWEDEERRYADGVGQDH